jgi:2-polyprenyl-3-methyl-5-hydroxy-6-metoxy-1,4-benzoquinol methylase
MLTRESRSGSCPICGSGAAKAQLGHRDIYEVVRCDSCRHSYVWEMPTSDVLSRVYSRYSYDADGALENVPSFLMPVLARLVESFGPFRRTNRLLDIGFGAGALLRAAQEKGWDAHGIETSQAAVEQARRHGLAAAQCGDFLTAPLSSRPYDVVIMSELVEHLPRPLPFLQRAREVVAEGGVLYLTTPHGSGLSARMLGVAWSVCAPPEHLHLFSVTSMRIALEASGFTDVKINTRGLHPHELVAQAKSWLGSNRRSNPPSRVESSYRLNEALTRTPTRRALKWTANAILNATRMGDGLAVWARP